MANEANYKAKIVDALKTKACLKQNVYDVTLETFNQFKKLTEGIAHELNTEFDKVDSRVHMEYKDSGKFEFRLKFSGDTLVFNMHSNVFNFPEEHFIHKSKYVGEDNSRGYCGMIEIYNFLSDSFKYQRLNDAGTLIARIFINEEKHFFVEGERQLGFLYEDFDNLIINEQFMQLILEATILYAIQFDLWAPDYKDVKEITVLDKIKQTGTQTHKTSKRLGFDLQAIAK